MCLGKMNINRPFPPMTKQQRMDLYCKTKRDHLFKQLLSWTGLDIVASVQREAAMRIQEGQTEDTSIAIWLAQRFAEMEAEHEKTNP